MGDDTTGGIIVLPPEHEVGTDAIALLELVDEVLDIAVTPDRGYCLSMRGVARETAIAYGLPLRDPALLDVPAPNAFGYPVKVADPIGCDRFTARTVTGLDPEARSPIWLQRRLQKAGMRPISLAVDVTNYVMLELGQPLHAYDRTLVDGPIGVRRAEPGEKLTTLDGAKRNLDADDLVITDDRGPIGLAGVMGGANTEIADPSPTPRPARSGAPPRSSSRPRTSTRSPSPAPRAATSCPPRRPSASSAASTRRPRPPPPSGPSTCWCCSRAAPPRPASPRSSRRPRRTPSPCRADHPDRVAGVGYGRETVVRRLQEVGCDAYGQDELLVTVPSWRPDLTEPNDLAEEVIRLEGYENLPSTLPKPPAGPRPDRASAAAPQGRPRARRGRVTSRRRTTRSSASRSSTSCGLAADDANRARRQAGQPALRRGAGAAHHAAAGPPRRAAPQRRPGLARPGALRDRSGLPPDGDPRRRRPAARRPPSHRRGDRRARRRAARAAAPRRRRPGRRARAGRLVGQGPPGRLGRRGRGRPDRRPGGGGRTRRRARASTGPGTRAAAPRCSVPRGREDPRRPRR